MIYVEWKTISIPKRMFEQIKAILAFTGHTSVSEYVRAQINRHLTADTQKAENYKEYLEGGE